MAPVSHELSAPSPPLSLDRKVVIVTGAGRGIGREIALQMAAAGARIVVNDIGAAADGTGRDESPALEVVAAIRKSGGKAVASLESVAEAAGAARIVAAALDSFGALDCVVNNAGILRDGFFHKLTEVDWHAVIGVHLNGSYHVSRAAAPHFRAKGSGCFVHMTSTSGLIGNCGQANYAAAKMGVVGLSKAIALDMARFGVRSNCIAPFADTRLVAGIPTRSTDQERRVAWLKASSPAQIAPLVVFLTGDAARDVTGQVFAVRGNEVFLMSQPRPIRSVHRSDGWTSERLAEHMLPALRPVFYPLDVSADVFCWDPI